MEKKYPDRNHGKQTKQRLKPYIVLQYLLRNTDEEHFATGKDIEGYLREICDIYAERRSIYKDIDEINEVNWMLENDATITEAEAALADDEYDEEKLVVYDKSRKGYYVKNRHFDLNDIRLLAECVNSSKFVSRSQAEQLIDKICEFVSDYQAEKIITDAFVIDRPRTTDTALIYNISMINSAMSHNIEGEPHEPEKISFYYMKHSMSDNGKRVAQRKGEKYIVSPFRLMVNDGNYYLIAFDDKSQKIRTYRVDRMNGIGYAGEPREGEEQFREMDIQSFVKRTFSMFTGDTEYVSIRFPDYLLDTVIERFGKKGASYSRLDDKHFSVFVKVDVSEPFFGWLSSFGKRAKITAPQHVVEQYKSYLDKLRSMYD